MIETDGMGFLKLLGRFLQEVGSFHEDQIIELLQTANIPASTTKRKLKKLCEVYYVKREGKYYIHNPLKSYNRDVLDALWVALEHTKNDGENRINTIFGIWSVRFPFTLAYLRNNNVYMVVNINSPEEISKLIFAESIMSERIPEGYQGIRFIAIVKDEESIENVKRASGEFPVMAAIVKHESLYSMDDRPDISFQM